MDVSRLIRPGIRKVKPYAPGKPVEEVQRELGLEDVIKLASNENPEGPLPEVLDAINAAAREINRYPDGSAYRMTRALADHLDVRPESILLGNGSNEVLDMLVRAVVSPGENFLFSQHSFIVYSLAGSINFETGRSIPMQAGWRHDLEAMADAIDDKTKLIIVCNPNNPTGTYNTAEEFEAFYARVPEDVIVALDEAYYEYVVAPDYPQVLPMIAERPNLMVLRTFSKIHSLAGLRLGYGVGDPALIGELQKTREPFNVNMIGQAAAIACLAHWDQVAPRAARNREQLELVSRELAALGFDVVPSQTNFVFCTLAGRLGGELAQELLKLGVIVRPMDAFGLPDGQGAVRISIGTPDENQRCLAALRQILG
jgi:histidinol-phosphate aminotransferase